MDVTSQESVHQAIDTILKEAGKLDVLINNAGLAIAGPVESLPLDEVQRVFDTNVMGVLRTMQLGIQNSKQGDFRVNQAHRSSHSNSF